MRIFRIHQNSFTTWFKSGRKEFMLFTQNAPNAKRHFSKNRQLVFFTKLLMPSQTQISLKTLEIIDLLTAVLSTCSMQCLRRPDSCVDLWHGVGSHLQIFHSHAKKGQSAKLITLSKK